MSDLEARTVLGGLEIISAQRLSKGLTGGRIRGLRRLGPCPVFLIIHQSEDVKVTLIKSADNDRILGSSQACRSIYFLVA